MMNIKIKDIKESNLFLNTLVDNITSAIIILDKECRIQLFNNGFCKVFNILSKKEVTGKYFGDLVGCFVCYEYEKKHCGEPPPCKGCLLMSSVKKSISNNESTYKEKFAKAFYVKENKKTLRYFQFTTKAIKYNNEKMALVVLDDISESEIRRKHLNNINKDLERKHKIYQKEMKMAQRVQRNIIPDDVKIGKRDEFDFSGAYLSMENVGGDLYDVIRIGKNGYGFLISDVSGHGVAAALITSMVKVSFNTHSHWGITASKVCEEVNKDLFKFIGDINHFLTAYYGIMNLETGTFQFTNAGHHPAILYRNKTKEILQLDAKGSLIGAFENSIAVYKHDSIQLCEDDKILMYTDGVVEARDQNGNFYDISRLIDFMKNNGSLSPKQFVDKLAEDIRIFRGSSRAVDDIAILFIHFRSKVKKDFS